MDEIDYLLSIIKEQHRWRLEDECSGSEIAESYDILKNRMTESLIKNGCRDFTLLTKIQNS